MNNEKEMQDYLDRLSVIRKGFSGIYRNTKDDGETWEHYAVTHDGRTVEIDPDRYYQMKGRYAREQKSHSPATRQYGNVFGFYLTF